MGLFGQNKDPESAHQETLVDQYSQAYQLMGIPAAEARQPATEFVQAGVAEVAARGWESQPANYGDALLRQERSNEELSASLDKRRKHGVTDDDIRWWWNMPPLDRVLIEKADEQNRIAAFIECMRQGMDGEEAARAAFKTNPKYGDLVDGGDPDGPIPIELKRRIVEWSERQQRDVESFRQKMANATSFNALVRTEIANGKL